MAGLVWRVKLVAELEPGIFFERACEKCGYGAILFKIRRMAAISISVSDVCTWYS